MPARYREGIGSALRAEVLACAHAGGWPLVLLLGDPGYYQRFGFVSAGSLGIVYVAPQHRGSPLPGPHALAVRPGTAWSFVYCWERARPPVETRTLAECPTAETRHGLDHDPVTHDQKVGDDEVALEHPADPLGDAPGHGRP